MFDEPTVGVDMGTRAQLYRVIKALAESGKGGGRDLFRPAGGDEPFAPAAGLLRRAGISAELTGEEINEETVLPHFFERGKAIMTHEQPRPSRQRRRDAAFAVVLAAKVVFMRVGVLPFFLVAALVVFTLASPPVPHRPEHRSMSRGSRSIWCSCRWAR